MFFKAMSTKPEYDPRQTPNRDKEQFYNELAKKNSTTFWFIMVVFLMCFPSFCYTLMHAPFMKFATPDFRTRCKIPSLERLNWTFDQIQSVAASRDGETWNCSYFLYNYTSLAEMDYAAALDYARKVEHPTLRPCKQFKHEKLGPAFTPYEEFSLVCRRAWHVQDIEVAPVLGELFAGLLVLPLGDILGRKRMVEWGTNMFFLGALLVSTASDLVMLVVGRFLLGVAFALQLLAIQSIVIEISGQKCRALLFMLVNCGTAVAFIIIPFVAQIHNWHSMQWTTCASVLFLPLMQWLIPESPPWLRSRGESSRAWLALKYLWHPAPQYYILLFFGNHKRFQYKQHMAEVRRLAKTLLYFVLLGALAGAVRLKPYLSYFKFSVHISRAHLFLLSGAAEFVSILVTVVLLQFMDKKFIVLLSCFSTAVAYLINFKFAASTLRLLFLLMADCCSSMLYMTLTLYVLENSPTSHRCTIPGLSFYFGAAWSHVMLFYINYHIPKEDYFFVVLCTLSFLSVLLSILMQENLKSHMVETVDDIDYF